MSASDELLKKWFEWTKISPRGEKKKVKKDDLKYPMRIVFDDLMYRTSDAYGFAMQESVWKAIATEVEHNPTLMLRFMEMFCDKDYDQQQDDDEREPIIQ